MLRGSQMAETKRSLPNPGIQFSSAVGSPEARRKMLLYKQLLKKELSRDKMRPRKIVTVGKRKQQQQLPKLYPSY
ncbi:uncharacterized protein LOC116805270 [Drosophila grimshawi]|uniref:uncharacterized protein LOC116805270 n=1 Tax=Drosophila grimshawi TaxID=7222 RepID=UPI000C86F205|nr:uncharacterized protein LOC116805270 [Drosophila grimshawi]